MTFYTFCDRIGNKIYHRFIDDEGKRRQEIITQFPIQLFIKGHGEDVSLYGDRLKRFDFNEISEAQGFIKRYADISPVYGQTSLAHQFIAHKYPGQIQFDMSKMRILNFDIETRFDGYLPEDPVKVRALFSNIEEDRTVGDLKSLIGKYEGFDIYNDTWREINDDSPWFKEGGFPEPDKADYEITSISCKLFGKDKRITFGLKDYEVKKANQLYIKCENESDLLLKFVNFVREIDPDIITGWYIDGFDIPYVVNRLKKVHGDRIAAKLSPFHASMDADKILKAKFDKMTEESTYQIFGLMIFDLQKLYKMFNPKKQEAYSLDFISEAELGKNKHDHSEFDDLMDFYLRDFQSYIDYNETDVELVELIDDKKQLIRLAITVVLMTKSRWNEYAGKVKPWDNLIYNMLLEKGIQIPAAPDIHTSETIAGAFVKDPIPGKYRWVSSLDLTALYPSICMMFNMSPETLENGADQDGHDTVTRLLNGEDLAAKYRDLRQCMSANGATFSIDKEGVLPRAMSYAFETRKVFKKKMLAFKKQKEKMVAAGESTTEIDNQIAAADAIQNAMKVLGNSLYGAAANNSFRYYNRNIAEGITLTGQYVIQYISKMINRFLNDRFKTDREYVIANDTDSAYIVLDRVPKDPTNIEDSVEEIDQFIQNDLQPFINLAFEKLSKKLGCKTNLLEMKREAICSGAMWRAKKNYVLLVHDMEGVRLAVPELKTVGIESVRTSTPTMVRKELIECYRIMLQGTNDDLLARLKEFKKKFVESDIRLTARPMGVSDVPGPDETRSMAYHQKAAQFYNNSLVNYGVKKKYRRIKNGDKIKLYNLKTPNPLRATTIAFLDELPVEFGLDKYLDKEQQYKNLFLGPVDSFASKIGWVVEKRNDLEELFG
jgi:DNA polymerase elongation subunit (family B)